MKQFIKTIITIMFLTILIVYSYALLQNKISGDDMGEFYSFLNSGQKNASKKEDFLKNFHSQLKGILPGTADSRNSKEKDTKAEEKNEKVKNKGETASSPAYHAVWVSYQEFNAYRNSVDKNNKSAFRKFFKSILKRCQKLNINTVIVQVRPYGDALYPSRYFPWAACISGSQGEDPGYDPLEIMVKETHDKGMRIEAWINPYRISSGNLIDSLSEDNMARRWAKSPEKKRNVLEYDEALYYNPSSEDVRKLIIKGVKEIVDQYEVDGIHMDDYFYPCFTEDNVESAFDAPEYEKQSKANEDTLPIEVWRRENVNQLVASIYETVHTKKNVTFGISPAGNLSNLRSPLEYYVDIDTWMSEKGYVDYIMPQIYWGFTNTQAPFENVLKEWTKLAQNSSVDLYIGLQMYRLGTDDKSQPDYDELQDDEYLKKQIAAVEKNSAAKGYCIFSYQYLASQKDTYQFDCTEFSSKRRKLLIKNAESMIK